MRPLGIHHVQVTYPPGEDARARAFYGEVLGLRELPKPEPLASRGGMWFELGGQQLHLGLEAGVERARLRSHVAYEVADLAAMRARLEAAGCEIEAGAPIPGLERFETRDPFGNRLELVERKG